MQIWTFVYFSDGVFMLYFRFAVRLFEGGRGLVDINQACQCSFVLKCWHMHNKALHRHHLCIFNIYLDWLLDWLALNLTEMAATRRGCVTPMTLPSAAQPASSRYWGEEHHKGRKHKDNKRHTGKIGTQWVGTADWAFKPKSLGSFVLN